MFSRVHIRNLRGVRDAVVENLGRVNLVVGGAGSGKTTLLEALSLHSAAAAAEVAIDLNRLRGVARAAEPPELFVRRIQEVFSGADASQPTVIAGSWGEQGRITTVRAEVNRPVTVETDRGVRQLRPRLVLSARLERSGVDPVVREVLFLDGDEVLHPAAQLPDFPCAYRGISAATNDEEIAGKWSELERAGRADGVLTLLRRLAPQLAAVRITVVGTVPYLSFQLVDGSELSHPALLGMGFARALFDLLWVVRAENGVAAFDEYDNSVHVTALPLLAEALVETAFARNVQLFLSTHRDEGIRAILAAAGPRSDQVRVVRAVRSEHGPRFETLSAFQALDAMDSHDFDLRLT